MSGGHRDPDPGPDADPVAARVRQELARLGADTDSAPDVPADVTARVEAALRNAGRAHGLARPPLTRPQRAGLTVGLGAVAVAVAVGTVGALTVARDPAPTFPAGPTASQITVDRSPSASPPFPLTDRQLRDALTAPADLGALTDRRRLSSCLSTLGYPPTRNVLGGRSVQVSGQPATLLLLGGDEPRYVDAVIVASDCGGPQSEVLAATSFTR